jgi:hypothetical protein
VAPEVAPTVQLGRGQEETFRALESSFRQINQVIRPAVIEEQTAKGEAQAVDAIEKGTFEPAKPFSIRSRAFNATADKIITPRVMGDLADRLDGVAKMADGDVRKAGELLDKVKGEIFEGLPELEGLESDLMVAYDRGRSAVIRQTSKIAENRRIAAARAAAGETAAALDAEAGFLALNGATPEEVVAALTDGQERLVEHGPRGEFTVNGTTYPADPTRLGTLTAAQVQDQMDAIRKRALTTQFETGFSNAEDKAGYMEAFREELLAGNTPFSPGEGIEMLRVWGGRAYTQDQRRKAAEHQEVLRLRSEAADQLSPYMAANEAGFAVPIPEAERQSIREKLAGDPAALREANEKFALVDAYAEIQTLEPAQRHAYITEMRDDIAEAITATGEIDTGKLKALEFLEDTLKKLHENIDASSVGLNMAERLVRDGVAYDKEVYDGMREAAAGDPEVLEEISAVEALHQAQMELVSLPPEERQEALQELQEQITAVLETGRQNGREMQATTVLLEGLEDMGERLRTMASRNPVAYAQQTGTPLASFEGVEGLPDMAAVVTSRMRTARPRLLAEGATEAVPLTEQEVQIVAETFAASPSGFQLEFLAQLSELEDQGEAMLIMRRLGQSEPALYYAGGVYAQGNPGAAALILKGASEVKLEGGTTLDVTTARHGAIGGVIQENLVGDVALMDNIALSYARGVAISEGGTAIDVADLEEGFLIAMGRQPDGTGGAFSTAWGETILPPGWDGARLRGALRGIEDIGAVDDGDGGTYSARDLFGTRFKGGVVEKLRPVPGDPTKLIPLDENGRWFMADGGPLIIDLEELK